MSAVGSLPWRSVAPGSPPTLAQCSPWFFPHLATAGSLMAALRICRPGHTDLGCEMMALIT